MVRSGHNHQPSSRRQAQRALERQLEYQRKKSKAAVGHEPDMMAAMRNHSQRVRTLLQKYTEEQSIGRVIEIGSGSHGLIFFFDAQQGVGLDPLAVHYRGLFPAWQTRVQTIAAVGEQVPVADQTFDIVLCDNVVDHAEDPAGIVGELARILKPNGLLYFTVNVHHPIYSIAARAHSTWNALGLSYEIGPFADHTTHLTFGAAQRLFSNQPFAILHEAANIEETKARARSAKARHAGDRLKTVFFKNALYEVVAQKQK